MVAEERGGDPCIMRDAFHLAKLKEPRRSREIAKVLKEKSGRYYFVLETGPKLF